MDHHKDYVLFSKLSIAIAISLIYLRIGNPPELASVHDVRLLHGLSSLFTEHLQYDDFQEHAGRPKKYLTVFLDNDNDLFSQSVV